MPQITRRQLLKLGSLSLIGSKWALGAGSPDYTVGVGRRADPYFATLVAVQATNAWPGLGVNGKTVVIKPNLVVSALPDTGLTTDPEVVRAIVDLSLTSGAVQVLIVETAPAGQEFNPVGYETFDSYDPLGRVSVVDLGNLPVSLIPAPGGLNFESIYAPSILADPDTVLISIGKMKTHWESVVSLSVKNLFGLPDINRYFLPGTFGWASRYALHLRGLNHTIADIHKMKPIDFAVIDGIWGLEGNGPILGTPIRRDTVLAGHNAIAVDRVAMAAMGLPQTSVRHLHYLSQEGFGPFSLGEIDIQGDALVPTVFRRPTIPPVIDPPLLSSESFDPRAGGTLTFVPRYFEGNQRLVLVEKMDDANPQSFEHVRVVQSSAFRPAGFETLVWDGRGDDGAIVAPGQYRILVRATSLRGADIPHGYATRRVTVL